MLMNITLYFTVRYYTVFYNIKCLSNINLIALRYKRQTLESLVLSATPRLGNNRRGRAASNQPIPDVFKNFGGGVELRGGGIEQKRKKREKLMDTDNSAVIARGRWVEGCGGGIRGINGDGRRLDLG